MQGAAGDDAGRGAEEQVSRRARRVAQLLDAQERGEAVDAAVLERLRRDQRAWAAGAEGERQVADVLAHLTRYGWTVLHDVRWPGRQRANLDHVAIGPGGVFVVDAKNWSGDVRVSPDGVRQNGYGRDAAVEGVSQAAAAVTTLLAPQHRSAVRGVMCLAGQQDQPVTTVQGVTVCGQWQLPEHLLAQPVRLSVYDVVDVARHLHAELGAASGPVPTPRRGGGRTPRGAAERTSARSAGRSGGRSAGARGGRSAVDRRRRRRASLGGALTRLVLWLGAVLFVVNVVLPRMLAG
ncbi:hypothetical protein ATM99_15120 [Cellulomonas sp. B6]|nr:hypothetical protein ATM99_15120 [Cellulomonas sp. B6]